jgi:hypothetical protein
MRLSDFTKRYLLCLLLLNLVGCSTMQPVSIEGAMQNSTARGIDYGSLVEVKTLDRRTVKFRVTDITELDRRTVKFRVTDITEEGIGGNQGFYRYEDMKSLRVENPYSNNSDETLAWILGALGIAALIALVANADSVAICSPSPCPQP